jgi:hypothetical protein
MEDKITLASIICIILGLSLLILFLYNFPIEEKYHITPDSYIFFADVKSVRESKGYFLVNVIEQKERTLVFSNKDLDKLDNYTKIKVVLKDETSAFPEMIEIIN